MMELDEALARIAALEGELSAVTAERDTFALERDGLAAERDGLAGQLADAALARDTASGELATARTAGLGYLRRALLAESAGQCIPELVTGDNEEALLASLEVAKGAYERALDTVSVPIVRRVPVGAPSARSAPTGAGLSPLELIESGLRDGGQ